MTNDPIRGAKVPKRQAAERVATSPEPEPQALEPEPPALTEEERELASAAVPEPPAPPAFVPSAPVRRFRVVAGGRAWWKGQQIRFQTGEEFTAETWEDRALQAFRECGVTIEEVS